MSAVTWHVEIRNADRRTIGIHVVSGLVELSTIDGGGARFYVRTDRPWSRWRLERCKAKAQRFADRENADREARGRSIA